MSEQYITQIEDKISTLLEGDTKDRFLKFVKYLFENQMQLKQWWDDTSWRIPYGENYLFGIGADKDIWVIWFFMGDYKGEFDEEFLSSVHSHVNICSSCHGDNIKVCPKGKDMTIFGKEFKNACIQFTIHFENPKDDDFTYIKELIEYYKGVVSYSDSFHVR